MQNHKEDKYFLLDPRLKCILLSIETQCLSHPAAQATLMHHTSVTVFTDRYSKIFLVFTPKESDHLKLF